MAPSAEFKAASAAFRAHVPDLTSPRFTTAKQQDVYQYADHFHTNHAPPWLFDLTQAWEKLYNEPYRGVTADGKSKRTSFSTADEPRESQYILILLQALSKNTCTGFKMKDYIYPT
jgi:hypothetical protein